MDMHGAGKPLELAIGDEPLALELRVPRPKLSRGEVEGLRAATHVAERLGGRVQRLAPLEGEQIQGQVVHVSSVRRSRRAGIVTFPRHGCGLSATG
jgi:hypothetical protein